MVEWILSLSHEGQVLFSVAILWLSGFLMSRVTKVFHLPNVTGYILAGVAIGPYALGLIPPAIAEGMDFLTDVALAFIAFGVGRYLRLEMLNQQDGKVLILTLMEALVTAAVVTLIMLTVFRLPLAFSLLLGAIGSATAPASSLMTIRQYRAKGDFVNTLVQVVAMDDVVALLAFSLCAAVATAAESTADASLNTVLVPLGLNIAVLLGSYLLGRLLCVLLNGRSSDHRLVLTCAFIFLITAACASLNISPLLGCMALGATYVNVSKDKSLFKQVNRVSPPINVMFFVLSGMRLNLGALSTVGVIGVAYFAVRIVGKFLGTALGAYLTGASTQIRRYLGLALIPQAGVSIGLAVLSQRILPAESGALLSTIILSSSVLYEMIGPICAKRALVLARAIKPESLPAAAAGKQEAGKSARQPAKKATVSAPSNGKRAVKDAPKSAGKGKDAKPSKQADQAICKAAKQSGKTGDKSGSKASDKGNDKEHGKKQRKAEAAKEPACAPMKKPVLRWGSASMRLWPARKNQSSF